MKPNINEATINKADINAIFKSAAEQREKQNSRFFGSKKDKINVEDLQQAWARGIDDEDEEGLEAYSTDTEDIRHILLKFGYDEKDINKVFAEVFHGSGSDYDEPEGMKGVQKIADFAKKSGLDRNLISFLKREFSDELGLKETVMYEEVKQIFTRIVQKRPDPFIIKTQEKTLLGRNRK